MKCFIILNVLLLIISVICDNVHSSNLNPSYYDLLRQRQIVELKLENEKLQKSLACLDTEYASKPKEKETRCDCSPFSSEHELFQVACSAKKSNGTWTVIQRRFDGKVNFYRPWAEYKAGFGKRSREFFIGLDKLHLLTTCTTQELRIEMMDSDNQTRYAEYDLFEIGDERESYVLKELGKYSGSAGDSLNYHKQKKFSTFDRDNDKSDEKNCARKCRGAWWYNSCLDSNLNGEYGNIERAKGINWSTFRGYEHSLKFVEMKIRPKEN